MEGPTLLVFKGKKSQTGLAATQEFPDINFQGEQENFDEIAQMLKSQNILAILPMWNSHEGEIIKAKVLELLFEDNVRLYRIWPKSIQFQCLSKTNDTNNGILKIISVSVAAAQCSKFIADIGAEFVEVQSTVDAYKEFNKKTDIQMALCAPGQNVDEHKILRENAANPMNFTTFALLGCVESKDWSDQQWGALYEKLNPERGTYLGVQMPIRSFVTSEDQEVLLSELADDIEVLDDVPKVLFVTRRSANRCGLLIDAGNNTISPDILTEEGYSSEIEVNVDLGRTNSKYPERVDDFINDNFAQLIQSDFIRHFGTQTCFFACPALGLVTHGYDHTIVEPVVKRFIIKLFELIDNGINCSEDQRAFFEKHKEAYYDKGSEFINFVDVGLS